VAGSELGLSGVKLEVVAAVFVASFKCWPLMGSVSAWWFRGAFWWIVGRMEWQGEIPVLLQDDGGACGRRHLLEGVV
jgi:hypothetical protein